MRYWRHIWLIKNKNRSRRGFTLVEMLLVITLFSIICVSIASSLFSGLKLWSRAKNVDMAKTDFLLAMEVIGRELRQSVDLASIQFKGDASEFSFPSLVGNSILKITYKFEPQQKFLIRSQVELKDVVAEMESKSYTEKKVASLDTLSLAYLVYDAQKKQYSWEYTWPEDKGVFKAVRLQGEYNGEEFNKTFYIPIS